MHEEDQKVHETQNQKHEDDVPETDYERERRKNIERNKMIMMSLGLHEAKGEIQAAAQSKASPGASSSSGKKR